MSAEQNVRDILVAYGITPQADDGYWSEEEIDGLVADLANLVRRGPVPPVSETKPMSVAGRTVIPDGLCGVNGCVFKPHTDDYPHTWQIENQAHQEGTT